MCTSTYSVTYIPVVVVVLGEGAGAPDEGDVVGGAAVAEHTCPGWRVLPTHLNIAVHRL